jgi:immune inhibitor A
LSSYAGKKIRLRFEYVTDGGPPGEGLYLDDITLAAVGYKDNVEAVDSTWTRQGFMRVTGDLPQHGRLT